MRNIHYILRSADPAIWLFLLLAFLILWRLLLPGYVLTMDMVFGPRFIEHSAAGIPSAVLINAVLRLLSLAMPMWLLQKILLISLFFCLGYLPYRFLPFLEQYWARIFAGLFYIFNPFVYERLIAGQWMMLFALSLLPPLLHELAGRNNSPSWRRGFRIAAILTLIANFSPHYLLMSAFLICSWLLFRIKNIFTRTFFAMAATAAAVFAILNGFWLISLPAYFGPGFDQAHFESFSTAADPRFGSEVNVLMLYGFWGEHEPWINTFSLPKDSLLFLYASLFMLVPIAVGAYGAMRQKRDVAWYALFVFAASFILSLGVSASWQPVSRANMWLLDNFPFYSGFRDTQKWSGLILVVYSFFSAYGVGILLNAMKKSQSNLRIKMSIIIIVSSFIPLVSFLPFFLGGFGNQLASVKYPMEWKQADIFLQNNAKNQKVLFLPWHQYLTFSFNFNILSANPASNYFHNELICANDMELGRAKNQSLARQTELDHFIETESNPWLVSKYLANINIKYIIFSSDLILEDPYEYRFLESEYFSPVWSQNGLTIFKNMLR